MISGEVEGIESKEIHQHVESSSCFGIVYVLYLVTNGSLSICALERK